MYTQPLKTLHCTEKYKSPTEPFLSVQSSCNSPFRGNKLQQCYMVPLKSLTFVLTAMTTSLHFIGFLLSWQQCITLPIMKGSQCRHQATATTHLVACECRKAGLVR